jgi:glycosyltransferase involved in cell wall biosynthesis
VASDSDSIRVSVCIPAYNEEEIIAETLVEAVEVLSDVPGRHEILVCDDGSSDRTWEILQELAPRTPMLRPLRHDGNQGNPVAQRTLVQAARGQLIFHIGADREWRMAEIPRMIAKLEEGHDIVIGVRRQKQYTLGRKVVSAGYNWLVALLWGKHFGDLGSIKLARASLWKRLPFDSTSAFLHAERILIAYRNGARIGTIPVEHRTRSTGTSAYADPRQAVRAFRELLAFRLSSASRFELPPDWRDA